MDSNTSYYRLDYSCCLGGRAHKRHFGGSWDVKETTSVVFYCHRRLVRLKIIIMVELGSDCVGRAVASDSRDPRFESRHQQTFIEHLFTVNCVEKTKIKKKEAVNDPFKKIMVKLRPFDLLQGLRHFWGDEKGKKRINPTSIDIGYRSNIQYFIFSLKRSPKRRQQKKIRSISKEFGKMDFCKFSLLKTRLKGSFGLLFLWIAEGLTKSFHFANFQADSAAVS